jgi:hypothetical protein
MKVEANGFPLEMSKSPQVSQPQKARHETLSDRLRSIMDLESLLASVVYVDPKGHQSHDSGQVNIASRHLDASDVGRQQGTTAT